MLIYAYGMAVAVRYPYLEVWERGLGETWSGAAGGENFSLDET